MTGASSVKIFVIIIIIIIIIILIIIIGKVCTNVEIEPQLQPPDNEQFNLRSTVTSPEARLDTKAGGFWPRGVTTFFDVRVTHVNIHTILKIHKRSTKIRPVTQSYGSMESWFRL